MPWQLPPEAAQGRFAPAAQRPAHDAPPGPFDDQPKPHLALFVSYEAPQLIAFQHFPPLALGGGRAAGRTGRRGIHRFFYPLGNRHTRHAREPSDAARGVALAQQRSNLGVLRGLAHRRRHAQALVAAGRARVLGLTVFTAVAPDVAAASFGAKMLRVNHDALYGCHPKTDHHQRFAGVEQPLEQDRRRVPAVHQHCAVGNAARGQLAQHVGHVPELGLAVPVGSEEAVINQPELVGVDAHAIDQPDAGNHAVGVAAVLAAHQIDAPAMVLVEHRIVEQDVAPRAEHDLRAHLLPELAHGEPLGFEKIAHVVVGEPVQVVG